MAKKQQQEQETTGAELDQAQAETGPRPPQGIVPRYLETGTRADFHRYHYGRAGIPDVRCIDPKSLRSPEGYDPFLAFPNGAVMQVRADHAAELLECDELTGGPSRHRLATEEEIQAMREAQKRSLR